MRTWIVAFMAATSVALFLFSGEALAQCQVCQPCTSDASCGAGGVCLDFGGGVQICSAPCNNALCPGDSRCYAVGETGDSRFCLNPGAREAICPASYTCSENRNCQGVGTDCSNNGAFCSADAELCVQADNGVFCSCFCATDDDCGPGVNSCITLSTGSRVCVPGVVEDACAGVTCPSGQVCDPNNGQCVTQTTSACPGLGHPDCTSCNPANDLCLNNGSTAFCSCSCSSDDDCGYGNGCLEVSAGIYACIPGAGEPEDLCEDVTCPSGTLCSPSTGTCIGGEDFGEEDVIEDTGAPDLVQEDTSPPQDVGNDTVTQLDTITIPTEDTSQPAPQPDGGYVLEGESSCSTTTQATYYRPLSLLAMVLVGLLVWRRRR